MGLFRQFPYSNFHEMNMDEILKILKTMSEEWDATKTEWASYKDYIDNYFANLDVSQEVLDAIRVLASTGELNQIIDPTIATATADWLAKHITPTTPVIDDTLTISGAGADAKVTGDFITNLYDTVYSTDLLPLQYMKRTNGAMNAAADNWIGLTSNNYQHLVIPVNEGDFFTITQSGNSAYWAFLSNYDLTSFPQTIGGRQSGNFNNVVRTGTRYIFITVKWNNVDTIPSVFKINDWNYVPSIKSELFKSFDNKIDSVNYSVNSNTPYDYIYEDNNISYHPYSFTSSGLNVQIIDPDMIKVSGTYNTGASRITDNKNTLKANTNYTLMVKGNNEIPLYVGIADSSGYITYNNNKVEVVGENSYHFNSGNSDRTGVYVYVRGSSTYTFNNDEIKVYLIEGIHSTTDFYIYEEWKKNKLLNKKVAWYGDSITQGYIWCQAVNNVFAFNATNCGSGGCRISYTSSRNDSMCLTDRMDGNYTPDTGIAIAIPSDVDIIFVEGGINDWGSNVNFGSSKWINNFDYNLFAEACNIMFDNLTQKFPNAEIYVIAPTFAKWSNHFTDTYGIINNLSYQNIDYNDVLCDVAGRWGIKSLNLARILGTNDNNVANYTTDGIHPNTPGNAKIAEAVIDFLSN